MSAHGANLLMECLIAFTLPFCSVESNFVTFLEHQHIERAAGDLGFRAVWP
jgi:hypothetical protein